MSLFDSLLNYSKNLFSTGLWIGLQVNEKSMGYSISLQLNNRKQLSKRSASQVCYGFVCCTASLRSKIKDVSVELRERQRSFSRFTDANILANWQDENTFPCLDSRINGLTR